MGVGAMARWLYPRMVPVHMYLLVSVQMVTETKEVSNACKYTWQE